MTALAIYVAASLLLPLAQVETVQDATSAHAGPRLGEIFDVEIFVSDGDLQFLLEAGYNVSSVSEDTALLHITLEEWEALQTLGFNVLRVDAPGPAPEKVLGIYHTYETLSDDLEAYQAAHPEISRLFTLGQSAEGRELWAMLISNNPDVEEDEPEFKYLATMHGDEVMGTELCVYFIDLLLSSYGNDDRITQLVDSTSIWIVPLVNPDGFEAGRRFNGNGFDLNRSFPAFPTDFEGTIFDGVPLDDAGRQPEVAHIMRWTAANSFVLSANFHGGALVVNYPYDHGPGIRSGLDAPSPDDLLFEDLSRRYSVSNIPMWNSNQFLDGITNGSDWFTIIGGMQDWNYRYAGCGEVTLEVSQIKTPSESQVPGFWEDNRESMLSYIEAVHIGVRGIVQDRKTGTPIWVQVLVDDNAQPVFTDPEVGDYHRLLLPGTYSLQYSAPGFITWTEADVEVGDGEPTRVDVELRDADVNDDGLLTAADVQFVVNRILDGTCPTECDLDGGLLTTTDLQAVINVLLTETPGA